MADSGFGEKSRRGGQGGANGAPGGDKENHSPNKRGVRKSLASTWMGAGGAGASNTGMSARWPSQYPKYILYRFIFLGLYTIDIMFGLSFLPQFLAHQMSRLIALLVA